MTRFTIYRNKVALSEKAAKDLVYHYTKKYVAIEKILFHKTLQLSPFRYTNDPSEYKDWSFTVSGTAHDGKMPDDSLFWDYRKVEQQINELVKSRYKIGCSLFAYFLGNSDLCQCFAQPIPQNVEIHRSVQESGVEYEYGVPRTPGVALD